MAELSIGDAVGAGFGLIRRRPATVLLWGFVQTLVFVVTMAVLAPSYIDLLAQAARSAGAARPPTPDLAGMMRLQGVVWLLNIANALVLIILYCGAFRSLIQPAQGRFGYLRLGRTELFLFLLLVGLYIAFLVALVIAMIPAALVIGTLVAVHAATAAVIAGLLLGGAALWAIVYVALRLSMIGPTTVDGGELRLGAAWAMTKGKTWRLFLMALCVFLIVIAVELVLFLLAALAFGGILGGIAAATGGAQALSAMIQQPATLLTRLAPVAIVGGLAAIPLYGALFAIGAAPWAKAYLDLRLDPSEAF
jgi:hypothetical protein